LNKASPPTAAQVVAQQKADAERSQAAAKANGPSANVPAVAAKAPLPATPDNRTYVQRYLDEVAPASIVGRMVKFDGKEGRYFIGLRPGSPVDITEIETLVELYAEPLFEPKLQANGRGTGNSDASAGPIDVEARLAAVQYQGAGDSGVHTTISAVAVLLFHR
jgi:hypothetical protein